jgi:hypothetical protein
VISGKLRVFSTDTYLKYENVPEAKVIIRLSWSFVEENRKFYDGGARFFW